jgi:hypothetical protein
MPAPGLPSRVSPRHQAMQWTATLDRTFKPKQDMPEDSALELTATLRRLIVQRDLTLGALANRNGMDLHVVLGLASTCLGADEVKNEIEVSRLLDHWLKSTGTMLRCDRAELRRWLVDSHYWQREDGGRRYGRDVRSLGAAGDLLEALARSVPELIEQEREKRLRARAARAGHSTQPPR